MIVNMENVEMLLLMSVFLFGFYFCVIDNKKPVYRRWWVRPTNMLRAKQGVSNNFIRELRQKDHKKYKQYMRMSGETFDKFLSIVGPDITKKYGSRKPIDPCTKLEICILSVRREYAVNCRSIPRRKINCRNDHKGHVKGNK